MEKNGLQIVCDSCQKLKPIIYPDSHFLHFELGVQKATLCSECAMTPAQRLIPLGMIRAIIERSQLAQPVSGRFTPIEVTPDTPESGPHEYWMEIGHNILEEMAMWQDKLLKFSLGGNRYKGLWVKPFWNKSQVTKLTIAGDTPSKKLELDVYQQARLSQLGLTESGRTNKIWEIELSEIEGEITNASSVILHILRYGYLLEPTDLYTITPTLDVDFSDPEWKHIYDKN